MGLEKEFEEVLLAKLQSYFDDKASRLEADHGRFNFKNKKHAEAENYFRNCFNGITDLQLQLFFGVYI